MDGVPPPPRLEAWTARGTKRTHGQMSGRDSSSSRRTRSPSASTNTDTYTPTHSASASTTPQPRHNTHPFFFFNRERPSFLRLPSFLELDAQRPRSVDLSATRVENPATSTTASTASTQMEVIDLTGEPDGDHHVPGTHDPNWRPFGRAQRGPRFPAEIIDLSGDTPQRPWHPQNQGGNNEDTAQDDSPEIQFLRERQLSPRLRFAGATPPAGRVPNRLHLNQGRITPIEIIDDDDIQIIRERRVTPPHFPPPLAPSRMVNFVASLGATARVFADAGLIEPRRHASYRAARRPFPRAAVHGDFHFEMPNLNFGITAFDLGYANDDDTSTEREESVVPPLDAAPEGFTRNPTEEDVLVCPNCDAELSVGNDEVKRQVWLVKGCGHIYCGECAASRLVRQRKGKAPANQKVPPLKSCVVEACGAKTTAKQMIQLFL